MFYKCDKHKIIFPMNRYEYISIYLPTYKSAQNSHNQAQTILTQDTLCKDTQEGPTLVAVEEMRSREDQQQGG